MAAVRSVACLTAALLLAVSVYCRVDEDPATLRHGAGGTVPQVNSAMCKVCGKFVDILEDVLGDQEVDDWLLHFVENDICRHLPETLQEKCMYKAPRLVPTVTRWIENYAYTALCRDIGVCGMAALDRVIYQEGQLEGVECTVCKNLTAIVKKEARRVQPETLADEIEQLKKHCEELHNEDTQDQCKQLVDTWGYMLVYFIEREKDEDVDKTCADLGMCPMLSKTPAIDPIPSDLVRKMMAYGASSNAADKCQRCEGVAQHALDDLANPDTQNAVATFISHPCAWIPVYAEECTAVMTKYTINVMNAIATHITAEEVCTKLAFCKDQERTHESHTTGGTVKPVLVH